MEVFSKKRNMIRKIKIILIIVVSFTVIFYGFLLFGKESTNFNKLSGKIIKFYEFKIDRLPKGWSLIAKGDLEIGWLYKLNGSSVTLTITEKLPKEKYTEKVNWVRKIKQF